MLARHCVRLYGYYHKQSRLGRSSVEFQVSGEDRLCQNMENYDIDNHHEQ